MHRTENRAELKLEYVDRLYLSLNLLSNLHSSHIYETHGFPKNKDYILLYVLMHTYLSLSLSPWLILIWQIFFFFLLLPVKERERTWNSLRFSAQGYNS